MAWYQALADADKLSVKTKGIVMHEAVTINFIDQTSNDKACICIRYNEKLVALSLSLGKGADCEVMMSKAQARQLLGGLQEAISH